jgi:hypothetical protein
VQSFLAKFGAAVYRVPVLVGDVAGSFLARPRTLGAANSALALRPRKSGARAVTEGDRAEGGGGRGVRVLFGSDRFGRQAYVAIAGVVIVSHSAGELFLSWANLVHIVAVDLGQCFGDVVG